jgi:mannitol PTS system EIIA component
MAVLSSIAVVFSDEGAVQQLLDATTPADVLSLLGNVNE